MKKNYNNDNFDVSNIENNSHNDFQDKKSGLNLKKIKPKGKRSISKKSNKYLDILSLVLLMLSALIFLALISLKSSGSFGNIVKVMYSVSFGYYASFVIPIVLGLTGFLIYKRKKKRFIIKISFILLSFSLLISIFISLFHFYKNASFFENFEHSYGSVVGKFGYESSLFIIQFLGFIGSVIFSITAFLILFMFAFEFHINQMLIFFKVPLKLIVKVLIYPFTSILRKIKKNKKKKEFEKMFSDNDKDDVDEANSLVIKGNNRSKIGEENKIDALNDDIKFDSSFFSDESKIEITDIDKSGDNRKNKKDDLNNSANDKIQINEKVTEIAAGFEAESKGEYLYVPPSIDLLASNIITGEDSDESDEQLKENARLLEEKLNEFSVEGKVVQINPGPVITQYEIKLAKGVKVVKISSLDKDLAMTLKARSIRIVAPIPGKDTVGIEIPNRKPSIVYLKSVIDSEKFINHKSKLAIALGKTISGENYILDLKKTPHLLIAGSTGSGKSVCINGLILSILYRTTPEEVQFCMIDPKMVELSVYNDLFQHHLLKIDGIDSAVVTDSEDAVRLLEALVAEMTRRYKILEDSGTRNLEEYNDAIDSKDILYSKTNGDEFVKMPYIVTIVDEYGDLMMTSGKAIEEPICRLAQMARAIGIHMVIATQRPNVKVVTGLIKANFPTRISFRVMSQIDSRTILDSKGAESLLGKGDMLIVPPGDSSLIRLQNALVETKEINRVVDHIKNQPTDFGKIKLTAKPKKDDLPPGFNGDNGDFYNGEGSNSEAVDFANSDKKKSYEDFYREAKRIVIQHQMASVSMLQRGLSIGYARAGKIIDQLEKDGVVGPHVGSKSREVLKGSYEDND